MVLTPEDIDAIAGAVVNKIVSHEGLLRVVREEIKKIATSVIQDPFIPPMVTDNERAKREALECREKSRTRRQKREAAKLCSEKQFE